MKQFKIKTILLILCSSITIVTLSIISCQKKSDAENLDTKFDSSDAKEWYYGTFKKSNEWLSYDSKTLGPKSPDWKYNTYRKVGNMEIIEFPLTKVKSKLWIPFAQGTSIPDYKRIAESSLSRISFIKRNGKITIREVDYIPDGVYLSKHNFDISHNSAGKLDADFAGRLIVKKWDETELSRNLVEKGRITKKGKLKKVQAFNPAATSQKETSTEALVCATYEICEYEAQCNWGWFGDILEKECSSWSPTGFCWTEQYCENEDDPCGGLGEEACQCAFYGECGSTGTEEPSPCMTEENANATLADALANANPVAENVKTSLVVPEFSFNGQLTREKNYEWDFYKGTWLNMKWNYRSFDHGVHKKVRGKWQWESLTHLYHTPNGTLPFETTMEMNSADGTMSGDKLYAYMELKYTVSMKIVCLRIPVTISESAKSENHFHVDD
ncbi:MAG: hypothetical protein ABIR18_03335 [Chitinophagaceae bacterium]